MNNQPTTSPLPLAKRKRLPTLKRAKPRELPGFRITDRDQQIIRAVYEHRVLTAPQIARLFFSSHAGEAGEVNSRCKHRLRMLYHGGYLFRDEQPQKLSEGRKPFVYFLDELGAEFISKSLGSEIDLDSAEHNVSYPFLDHLLATSEVRVTIKISARKHGWEILSWVDERTLKSPQMKDVVILKGKQGGRQEASVVPDSYFRLDATEDIYNFFLEIDRGTVTGEATEWGKRDWARKVNAYLEYYRSGKYQKRYETSDMRILTVTTSEKRLSHLSEITEKAGGKARFWFTTFDRIRTQDILTSPSWNIATRSEFHSLLPV